MSKLTRMMRSLRGKLQNEPPFRIAVASGDLRTFERKVCSQNGEDGIIEEIFRRIGASNRYFVEFGAQTGEVGNCANLAQNEGWNGLLIELDSTCFADLAQRYEGRPGIRCAQACVSSKNIESLLAEHAVPCEFDLLSIDIDGNDYWVWNAIRNWRPRVVIVEYNASFPPPIRWIMQENDDHRWDGTNYFGASLASYTALGRSLGYELVGTDSRGVNAFFVRRELISDDNFLDPVLAYHYTPPAYGRNRQGHPPGSGPYLQY